MMRAVPPLQLAACTQHLPLLTCPNSLTILLLKACAWTIDSSYWGLVHCISQKQTDIHLLIPTLSIPHLS